MRREAMRDKPVLARQIGDPDGGKECCQELLQVVRQQTELLERLIDQIRPR